MTNTHTAHLDELVARFLEKKADFGTFQADFADYFLERIPDSAMSPEELEYYGAIHEKSEWTALDPPKSDRKHGWIDESEFSAWLGSHRR